MTPDFRCGYVAITGRPNAGKSTLMNHLLGQKLSIISPKPQTTRQTIKGILNTDAYQIIFLDTPGFLEPRYELQELMRKSIRDAYTDADLILFITDAASWETDYDRAVSEKIQAMKIPVLPLFNKIDLVEQETLRDKLARYQQQYNTEPIPISALNGTGCDGLIERISLAMPLSPPFYHPDDLTDLPMRFFAQEIIREKIFHHYQDEIPYSSTVTVESFQETDKKAEIHANIWLERESQKPILIGKGGVSIKKIRLESEKELHQWLEKRVRLHLWVKIKRGWRKKKNALKEFGY